MYKRPRCVAGLVVGAFLAACSSGGGLPNGSIVNSPGGGPTQSPTKLVPVKVTVTIPPGSKVRPNYVSVNTQSLVIQLSSVDGGGVSGVNPTTMNTVVHARGCKTGGAGLVCTATAWGSPGQDVFSVTTYAGENATGSVLSAGTVRAKIDSGGGGVPISNDLSLALYGIIASLQLQVTPNSAKRGEPTDATVTLDAFDASGAQIVGSSDYWSAVQLSIQGSTNKAFALHAGGKSGSSLTIVKPTSKITLSYDGNRQASSITLAANVDGPDDRPDSIGKSVNFILHGKQPPPPVGTIYALNFGSNYGRAATVTEYDGKAKGNAAPERTLNLDKKLYARSIAVDAKGNLYVGYFDNQYGFSPSNGSPDKRNEIAIYAPGASGNDAPTAVIVADPKTKTLIFPVYMSIDGSGNLVTYGATAVDGNAGNDAMLIYAAGSSGPAAPANAWAFVSPALRYPGPTGLALDTSGNFYVNGALHTALGPSYGLFVAPASDDSDPSVNPSRTIPWDTTTELTPGLTTNVALADSGEIFIGNSLQEGSGSSTSCQGRANVYSAGAGGGVTDVPPLRILTLSGIFTTNYLCDSPRNPLVAYFPALALYGTTLFAADDFNNAVAAFPASAHGTVKPSLRIAGAATQLDAPTALVITSLSGQAKARPVRP